MKVKTLFGLFTFHASAVNPLTKLQLTRVIMMMIIKIIMNVESNSNNNDNTSINETLSKEHLGNKNVKDCRHYY